MNEFKDLKPTDDEVGNLEGHINEELLNKNNERGKDMIVTSIHYFNWDEKPRWFIHMVNEDWFMKQYAKQQGRDTSKYHPKYVEVICYPEMNGGGNCFPCELGYASHGWPCMSVEVWKFKEEEIKEVA